MIYVHNYIQMTAIELGAFDIAERCSTELHELVERFGGPRLGWFDDLHRLLAACIPVARGDATALDRLTEIVDEWRSATQTLQFTFGLLTLGRPRLGRRRRRRTHGGARGARVGGRSRPALPRRTAVAGRRRAPAARP